MSQPPDVTELLCRWRDGDDQALDAVLRQVYPDLRRTAARQLRLERDGHSLQPTLVINEVFLRLIAQRRVDWQSRAHFLAILARLTRRVLIDHARKRLAWKRGLGVNAVAIDDTDVPVSNRTFDVVALDVALQRLAALDARQARVVELRFFGGLTAEEAAEVLGVSVATVKRDWVSARLWLYEQLVSVGRG
jgi:RNA polymerase sigma factor (TIGR02999 family)